MVFLTKSIQSVISICEDLLLPPCLHCFYRFALIWVGLNLFLLLWSLIVLLCSFFVLFLYLLLRLYSKSKLLIGKIEESACHWFPFLLDVSLAVRININAFLFHQKQSLSIKVNLFLHIV
jgi:hypothetical protein